MSPRLPVIFLLVITMVTAGCGEDEPGANGNDWEFGDDAGHMEDAASEDDTSPPPQGVVPEALIGEPWYGVVRLTDDPAITGLYLQIEFLDEENVVITGDVERAGKWTIQENEDIYVYDLETDPERPEQPEQFIFMPDLDDDYLVALELTVPPTTIGPYRLRFERQGSADVSMSELDGRWQATETVTNEEGNSFYIAMRFDEDGFTEIGVVGENNNFFGLFSGDGQTQTFDTGRTYWTLIYPPGVAGHPVAGEVRRDDEELRVFIFTEDIIAPAADEESDPQRGIVVRELEKVERFSSE